MKNHCDLTFFSSFAFFVCFLIFLFYFFVHSFLCSFIICSLILSSRKILTNSVCAFSFSRGTVNNEQTFPLHKTKQTFCPRPSTDNFDKPSTPKADRLHRHLTRLPNIQVPVCAPRTPPPSLPHKHPPKTAPAQVIRSRGKAGRQLKLPAANQSRDSRVAQERRAPIRSRRGTTRCNWFFRKGRIKCVVYELECLRERAWDVWGAGEVFCVINRFRRTLFNSTQEISGTGTELTKLQNNLVGSTQFLCNQDFPISSVY